VDLANARALGHSRAFLACSEATSAL
jgi:hypothetical protein